MISLNPKSRNCVLILFLLLSAFTQSQAQVIRCATTEMDSLLRVNHPGMETHQQFEDWIQQEIQNQASYHVINGVYTIPVVFHVIHNGEAVGTGTNLSQAAIQSQLDVLNEDFRRMFGTNGYNTNPVGADTEIEFCMARRRPDGSTFAEPGINRINRNTAGFTAPPYGTGYIDGTIKTWTYNGGVPTATRGWDPGKYLNIWLCDISGGILGYAQFPESPLGGMGCGATNPATDGVVFLYSSIGKSSVTSFPGPYNEGRTATHEIGHWLGLRHIWGDGGCTVDDFCNDTPEAAAANFGCPTGTNSCTGAPDAGVDQIENYMDYTDDLCMNIFTQDQKMRMRAVLTGTPMRLSLINSDACVPPNANDASIVGIINPVGDNCAGAITPQVTLRNRGSSNLTSATISYTIDGGTPTTFAFSGSIAPGASANVTMPAFTTTLGTHTFRSYSTLPNGVADPSPLYDTTTIQFAVSNGFMGPYTQDFEAGSFPPDVKWNVVNVSSDCTTWMGESCVSSAGTFTNNAAMVRYYDVGGTTEDYLYTPVFIIPCNASAVNFTFSLAHRRRSTSPQNNRLRVEISTDCGTTWSPTPVYDQTGTGLATTTTSNNSFTPTTAAQWRTETVNLTSFVLPTSRSIKLRFISTSVNNGQNIWIDNFAFNTTTPGEANVVQSGVTILDDGAYSFGSTSVGSPVNATFTVQNTGTTNLVLTPPINITGTAFTVNTSFGATTIPAGGSTTFTITFNPPSSGTFTETLSFTTNDCDEGTYNFQLTGIATGAAIIANFTGSPTSVCIGDNVTFTNTSTGATSWSWNFGAGATPATATGIGPHVVTYSTAGSKTVALTINGSVTETKTNYITVTAPPTTSNAGPDQTICSNNVTMAANPATTGTGTWTQISGPASTITTAGSPTTTITGMTTAGTYVYQWTITNAPCPQSTDQVSIIRNTNPTTSNAGPDQTICASPGTVTMAGNTPTTGAGTWTQISGPACTITTPSSPTTTITGMTTAGTYVFRWQIANAPCTASNDNVQVIVTAAPTTSNAGPDLIICANTTTMAANTATVGTGTWTQISGPASTITTAGSPTTTITGMTAAGTYVYQWTITNTPCTPSTDQVTIIRNTNPTTSSAGPDQTICASPGTVTMAANTPATGTGGWTQISGPACTITTASSPTTTITGMTTAGIYVFQWGITNAPCTASNDQIQVTVTPGPTTSNAGPDQTICISSASATMAGNTPATGTGAWTQVGGPVTGTITTASSPTTSITGLNTAGTYTFEWTISSGSCSSSTDQIQVLVNGLPTASNAGPDQTICANTVTMAANTAGVGAGAWTQISGPACTITTPSSPTTTVTGMVTGGTYVFQWTITNTPCTASSDQVSIIRNTNPTTSNAGPDQTICSTLGTVTMGANTPTVGTGSWTQISGPLTATITTPTSPATSITGMSAIGTYVFQWNITNAPCTPSTDQVQVIIGSGPTVSISGTSTICNGQSTTLTASGATNYTWNTGPVTPGITVSPTTNTNYFVVGSDPSGCSDTAFQTVTVNSLPSVGISGSSSVCIGSSIMLTGTGATSYVWSTGPTTSTIMVSPTVATTYTVTGTDINNCMNTATTTINVNSLPTVNAGTDVLICPGNTTTLNATGGVSYIWNNGIGSTNPANVAPLTTTTYIVQGSDINNCSDMDTVVVNVSVLPTVTFTALPDTICVYNGIVTLGGSPVGGSFSGTAVSGTSFDPFIAGTGMYTLTYTVMNADNCPASDNEVITVIGCTGIDENTGVSIDIFPNPTDGFVNINSTEVIERIEVYDMLGKMIIVNGNNNQNLSFSMQEFRNGVYNFRIYTSKGIIVKRVIRK